MLTFALGALAGAFIGWAVPQPLWAANVAAKVKAWFVGAGQ